MIVRLYPDNPNEKVLRQVVAALEAGGVIIYPTDSVYALGCALKTPRAFERLKQLTDKKTLDFSVICDDISAISTYAKVDTPTFKLLKRNLPGAFTFLLNASSKTPNVYLQHKKMIGIRIPDHAITLAIVKALGSPLVSASVKNTRLDHEYTTDPSLLHDEYENKVELIVDGGLGQNTHSTIVDCTQHEVEILRQGRGQLI